MKYPIPFGERILVKRRKIESKIIIQSDKINEGEIIALGDKIERPTILYVGQNIIFTGYGITKVTIEEDKDNDYILMNKNDILAILV